jgi:tol-pal system-associated acyl-CoA thioesterase
METRLKVKVYYEDTDCMGLVYHANYLKFMERGRTDYIGHLGKPIAEWNAEGCNFAVYQMTIRFRQAARLGDELEVVTTVAGGSEYRRTMKQRILAGEKVVTEADVELVCLDSSMSLRSFPPGVLE